MFKTIREDIYSVFDRDPAARSVLEIIFCYPGLHAVWFYRIGHWFWTHGFYFLGRFTSHLGRFLTGVEIHPEQAGQELGGHEQGGDEGPGPGQMRGTRG